VRAEECEKVDKFKEVEWVKEGNAAEIKFQEYFNS
jgi:hypothetical protein